MDEDRKRWIKTAANFFIQVIKPMLKRKEIEYVWIDGVHCIVKGPNFHKNHPEYEEYDETKK